MTKEQYIDAFNALNIPDMGKVTDLNELSGAYINLTYKLPSGQAVKIWDDEKTYLGNQICKHGGRCYGLAAGDGYILVCEYGNAGCDPEIIVLKKV